MIKYRKDLSGNDCFNKNCLNIASHSHGAECSDSCECVSYAKSRGKKKGPIRSVEEF